MDNDERKKKYTNYNVALCEKCDGFLCYNHYINHYTNKVRHYCVLCHMKESDKEERKRMEFGRCKECFQINTADIWCEKCNAKRLQRDFSNWTSGNLFIDKYIQETQLNAQEPSQVLEWIPYDRLKNIEYFDKGGFLSIYMADWLDGPIVKWSDKERKWIRDINEEDTDQSIKVILKGFNKLANIDREFLNKVHI